MPRSILAPNYQSLRARFQNRKTPSPSHKGSCLLRAVVFAVFVASVSLLAAQNSRDTGPVESVQTAVESELAKLGEAGGIWGVYAAEEGAKRPIADLHGRTLFLPASNRKIVSTGLALYRLGPDYRFTTRLWAVGDVDAEGALQGDLILEASGDPTLRPTFLKGASGLSLFSEWARAVSAAGIRRVQGRVLVDCSVYQEPTLMSPGWSWDQLTETYGALPSALSVNENQVSLRIAPGSAPLSPCTVQTIPGFDKALTLENHSLTAQPADKTTLRILRSPAPCGLLILGDLPLKHSPMTLTVPLPNPSAAWAELFGNSLVRAGIALSSPPEVRRDRVAPSASEGKKRVLAEHQSPTLEAIVRHTNKESDNLCAEMLYLAAGGNTFGQASYEAAQSAEGLFLRRLGINTSFVEGQDGSGLGRTDLVAPEAVVDLLVAFESDPRIGKAFIGSLPISGKDGTLNYRMTRDGMQGRVLAKTGTLRDVSALSGYLHRQDGRTLAFSILANHFTVPVATVRATQDRLCRILFQASLP